MTGGEGTQRASQRVGQNVPRRCISTGNKAPLQQLDEHSESEREEGRSTCRSQCESQRNPQWHEGNEVGREVGPSNCATEKTEAVAGLGRLGQRPKSRCQQASDGYQARRLPYSPWCDVRHNLDGLPAFRGLGGRRVEDPDFMLSGDRAGSGQQTKKPPGSARLGVVTIDREQRYSSSQFVTLTTVLPGSTTWLKESRKLRR